MPAASFGSGLTSGILQGWSQMQQRKDELARAQRQQDIQNALSILQTPGVTSSAKDEAQARLQELMGDGKTKKGATLPNAIWGRIRRMYDAAHGGGQQQSPQQSGQPMSEAIPGGQGTSAAPMLPGRTPVNEQPIVAPAGQPNTIQQRPVLPSQQDRLTQEVRQAQNRLVAAQKAGNAHAALVAQSALERAQDALDKYQTAKEVAEARAESAQEVARIRADAEAEKQKQADLARQQREADSAQAKRDLAKQTAESKEREDKLRADLKKAQSELDEANKEKLKKTVPGKNESGYSSSRPQQASAESDNPESMRASILYEIMTGQRPAFGLGKSFQRDAYNQERAKVLEELGPQAEQLKAAYKAGNSGLTRAITQRVQIGAFENTFQKAIDQAEDASSNVPRSDSRLFNSWQQLAQANLTNNPELARFRVAAQTAINEYSRIVSSATGGGVSTDTARREAENILNTAMSKGSFSAALAQMKKEADFRTQGLDQEINRMVGQLGQSASGPGRGGAVAAGQPKTASEYLQSIGHQ